jgi:exonuclease VII small subunit
LERSVSAYEKGVVLMNHLRSQITGAEKKLELLQKSQEKKV